MKSFLFIFVVGFFFQPGFLLSENQESIIPFKTEKKIKVDGILDEKIWEKAVSVSEFIQYEPNKGKAATFKTRIKVLYNETHMCFGIRCEDPEPKKIIARLTRRDTGLNEDDSIAVQLDTFNDGRTAYYFITNLLGTQQDGRISDNGRTVDATWDGKWKSAAVKTTFGWTAEIEIDLSDLKFNPGEKQSWGLGFIRFIPRIFEINTWGKGPMESTHRVSQFGTLREIDLKKSKKKIEIIPHVISKIQKGEPIELEVGVDARYAMSQSISTNLTVNPDFATVEADQEQINLTRFELSLKEKRNFFLEGAEIYSQRIRLFYSRRIADIYGGLKLYGKAGGYEFSVMSAQSKKDVEVGKNSANFSVIRVRKDIFKSSTIGFLLANRILDGKSFGNVGFDVVHFFSEKVNFTGQLAMSYGEKNNHNLAFFLRPSYDSSTFHIHLRYTQLGENFADNANSVGFVRDDDRHELDSAVEKTWWIKKWGFDRIKYGSNYNIYWSINGILRSWQIDQELEFDFTNKWSFEIEFQKEFKHYEKEFHNHQVQFELGYNTREWQSARINYEFGKNFDSDYYLMGGGINFKLTTKLSIEYDLNRLFLEPDPEGDSTWIHVLRANYYFYKDLFLKAFFQTNSAINKENIQLLFVYRFQPPFGTIQLAYQKGTAAFGEKGGQNHTLFFKVSYVF